MGLDFCIQRRRKGEAYKSDVWTTVVSGRNCWYTRDIVLKNISTYDPDTYTAELGIGTLVEIMHKLSSDLLTFDMNDSSEFESDDFWKTSHFLGELALMIADGALDSEEGIEYDYRLIDSY